MSKTSKINAFSLVEVVFSLAIFVFVGFALIGLLGLGLQSSLDSKMRAQAATVAEELCATRRAAPTNDLTIPQPGFPLPSLATVTNNFTAPVYLTRDGGTNTVANSDFGFIFNIAPKLDAIPTGNTTKGVSTVYLCLFWPPKASPTSASTGHYELTTTFALP